jgi:hypothetical protein
MTTNPKGLQHNPKNNATKKVELSEDWVEKNFQPDYVQYLQSHLSDKPEFLLVPIGSSRTVATCQEVDNNPIVQYQQVGENLCAFASLSSCLHFIGFQEEASRLNIQWQDYYSQASLKESHWIMELIIDQIQVDPNFYHLRSKYTWVKLKQNHNILEMEGLNDGDIRWVSLWSEDGGSNHAVGVVGNYIFDCNCTNALPLTQQSLDECCVNSAFVSIRQGYHFIFKPSTHNDSKNSKKRKRKKERKREAKYVLDYR